MKDDIIISSFISFLLAVFSGDDAFIIVFRMLCIDFYIFGVYNYMNSHIVIGLGGLITALECEYNNKNKLERDWIR